MQSRWAKYRKIDKLGSGTFGTVYLAEGIPPAKGDEEWRMLGRVAVKSILVRDLPEKELQQAANEVSILSSMEHPHIVEYYEYMLDDEGYMNIVMQYAVGGDLAGVIDRRAHRNPRDAGGGGFEEAVVLDYAYQLLSALDYLQEKRIIHRDLKPANVFVFSVLDGPTDSSASSSEDARAAVPLVKLGDFGIAKALTQTTAHARTFLGTPYYIAPELMQGEPYSFGADVWSLGCILYELIALTPPFAARNFMALVRQICEDDPPPFPQPERYPKASALVANMLAKRVADRPSAGELLQQYFRSRQVEAEEGAERQALACEEEEERKGLHICHEELERLVLTDQAKSTSRSQKPTALTGRKASPPLPAKPKSPVAQTAVTPPAAAAAEARAAAPKPADTNKQLLQQQQQLQKRPVAKPYFTSEELRQLREMRIRQKTQQANKQRHAQWRKTEAETTASMRQKERERELRVAEEERDQQQVQLARQVPLELQKAEYFYQLDQRRRREAALQAETRRQLGETEEDADGTSGAEAVPEDFEGTFAAAVAGKSVHFRETVRMLASTMHKIQMEEEEEDEEEEEEEEEQSGNEEVEEAEEEYEEEEEARDECDFSRTTEVAEEIDDESGVTSASASTYEPSRVEAAIKRRLLRV